MFLGSLRYYGAKISFGPSFPVFGPFLPANSWDNANPLTFFLTIEERAFKAMFEGVRDRKGETMRAALLEGEKRFKMVEVPEPECERNEVIIGVMRVGICGSEIEAFFGRHPFRKPPVITGHEMSGRIEKVGVEVRGVHLGDQVTVEPQVACGSCVYCQSGRYNLCRSRIMLGTAKWQGPFGELIKAPASKVVRLPDGMTFDEATLAEPLAVGVHAIRRTRLNQGESLILFGAGTIGLCTLVAARAIGVENILVIDISEKKRKMGQALGAQHVLDARDPGFVNKVKGFFPEGADVVIVATGALEAYRLSTKVVKRDGRIGVVGLSGEEIFIPNEVGCVGTELEVIGCTTYLHSDFQEAVKILPTSRLREIISRIYPIEKIQEAFETFVRENETYIKVILAHRQAY